MAIAMATHRIAVEEYLTKACMTDSLVQALWTARMTSGTRARLDCTKVSVDTKVCGEGRIQAWFAVPSAHGAGPHHLHRGRRSARSRIAARAAVELRQECACVRQCRRLHGLHQIRSTGMPDPRRRFTRREWPGPPESNGP